LTLQTISAKIFFAEILTIT